MPAARPPTAATGTPTRRFYVRKMMAGLLGAALVAGVKIRVLATFGTTMLVLVS